jgi:hypothetical protein
MGSPVGGGIVGSGAGVPRGKITAWAILLRRHGDPGSARTFPAARIPREQPLDE